MICPAGLPLVHEVGGVGGLALFFSVGCRLQPCIYRPVDMSWLPRLQALFVACLVVQVLLPHSRDIKIEAVSVSKNFLAVFERREGLQVCTSRTSRIQAPRGPVRRAPHASKHRDGLGGAHLMNLTH